MKRGKMLLIMYVTCIVCLIAVIGSFGILHKETDRTEWVVVDVEKIVNSPENGVATTAKQQEQELVVAVQVVDETETVYVNSALPQAVEKASENIMTVTQSKDMAETVPESIPKIDEEIYVNTQIVVQADKLTAEELEHCTYQLDSYYVLEYDTPFEAEAAKEKYEQQRSVENVEYVKKVSAWDTGEDDYTYLSYGPEQIKSNVFIDQLLQNAGGVENLPEIVVAVMDSGIDTDHPFFQGRVIESNYDFIENDNSVEDYYGHGTHVAGIIVDATTENVKIKAYQVLDANGGGSEISIAQGIRQAIDDGVDVINLSLGGQGDSVIVDAALDQAIAAGIIIVVAAGNENQDVANVFPANYQDAITVASVNNQEQKSEYSNYGSYIDFAAPGEGINSTTLNNGYLVDSGTSQATPFVAAAVALLCSYDTNITNTEVYGTLKLAAKDLGNAGWDAEYGYGQICLENIVISDVESAPMFSVYGGEYDEAVTVEITAGDSADIYYTLDGSFPTKETGTLYVSPIVISKSAILKAVAVNKDGTKTDSDCVTDKYYIGGGIIESDFTMLPDEYGMLIAYSGTQTKLSIPEEIDGIPVKAISMDGRLSNTVKTVIIPDHVEFIEAMCFYTSSVENIYIGKNVAYLTTDIFPYDLKSLEISEENPYYKLLDDVLYTGDGLELVYYPPWKTELEYSVLDGTRYIQRNAFWSATLYLRTLKLPQSLVDMGIDRSSVVSQGAEISLQDQLVQIYVDENNLYYSSDKNGALYDKNQTVLYYYPSTVTNTEFVIPTTVERIAAWACIKAQFETVVLPENLCKIDEHAFAEAPNLKKIVIPAGVEVLEWEVFYGQNTKEIYFEGDAPKIIGHKLDNSMFAREYSSSFVLGDADTKIYYYPQAKGFERFEGVATLGERTDGAYQDVRTKYAVTEEFSLLFNKQTGTVYGYEGSIDALSIPGEIEGVVVKAIAEVAFKDASIGSIVIPDTVARLGAGAFMNCATLTFVDLGEGIEVIEPVTFYGCNALKSIELGSKVKEIGENAFGWNFNLENVKLPNSVKIIDVGAFSLCENIVWEKLPESLEYVGSSAFGEGVISSELILPPGNLYIDRDAFGSVAGLEYVVIPSNVKHIGYNAFVSGASELKYVCYVGDGTMTGLEAYPDSAVIIHQKDAQGFEQYTTVGYSKMALDKITFDVVIKDNVTGILEQKTLYAGQSFAYDLDSVEMAQENSTREFFVNGQKTELNQVIVEQVLEDILIEIEYNENVPADSVTDFVTRMYQQCLSRDPDQEGLDGWVGQLKGGHMNGAQIAEQFVFSNEMLSKNLSDEEFVNVLYRAMMGREADEAGRAGWVNQLSNGYMTRSEVTKAFVESTEFSEICSSYGITRGTYNASIAPIEHFVTRFYTLCLERKPDQAGLYGWVNNLKNQYMNGAQIAEQFFFSDEFIARNVSDEKYIELLYNTLMGRASDAEGKKGWVGQLQNGNMTRRDMMKAFIESDEFTEICEAYGITRGTVE